MKKRVILIILDSLGIGGAPDAPLFGDVGSDTLGSISKSSQLRVPNLTKMGLFNIDDVTCGQKTEQPTAKFARLVPKSMGKDTTVGHWELAGVVSEKPLPTYLMGFPDEIIKLFEEKTGRKTLCNKPYSGTKVIADYGEEHAKTGALIVYTSADSVFQIAANEAVVSLEKLYEYCETARTILTGEHGVGRVIARPFVGDAPSNYKRTSSRHDYSLSPPEATMLDRLTEKGVSVTGVGKIHDIFAGRGVTNTFKTKGNADGCRVLSELLDSEADGLIFVNLVDFDMLYGHRNDVDGYAKALTQFDEFLPTVLERMAKTDMLIITADHGCDPGTASTDHSRECVPLLIYDNSPSENLGTIEGFDYVATVVEKFLG